MAENFYWPAHAVVYLGRRYKHKDSGYLWDMVAADSTTNNIRLNHPAWPNVTWSGTYQEFVMQFTHQELTQ